MEDFLTRVWENIAGRMTGPMKFRFLFQPLMAVILAVRAGLRDARAGKPAFLWAVFSRPEHRRDLLHTGWRDIGKVVVIAMALDLIYQLIALPKVYWGEDVVVALLVAVVPYVLLRGPVTRLARKRASTP